MFSKAGETREKEAHDELERLEGTEDSAVHNVRVVFIVESLQPHIRLEIKSPLDANQKFQMRDKDGSL